MKTNEKDLYGNSLELPKTNWNLFESLLGTLQVVDHKGKELMNPYEVLRHMFELTSQHYNFKYVNEKVIREKYEARLIDRRGQIEKRNLIMSQWAELTARIKSGDATVDDLLAKMESDYAELAKEE